MAGIDNASKFRSKEDEERLRRQKAKNPTNVSRARELAKQYSNPHKAKNTVTVTRRIDNEKWYAGDKPTARETYARIYQVAGDDQNKLKELQGQYAEEIVNPGSVIYNPYAQATNYKAINGLRELGIDVPDVITDQWVDKMWGEYGQYGRQTTTSYGPSAPTKSSTRENDIAYWVNTLMEDKENTNLAEAQMKSLYDEVAYLTKQGYSDNEIVKRVRNEFGSKYNVLNKMDEERMVGSAVRLNRAVDYSGDDTLYGMIWAARNDGGTGDYFSDAVNYAMGNGKKYKADPSSEAALDPTSLDYNPYGRGGTIHDLQMKYGVTSFSREWLDKNRATILSDPDGYKDIEKIQGGIEDYEKATAELAELDKWVEKQITRGATMENIEAGLKALIKDGGDEYGLIKVPTLKKMEDKRYAGTYLGLADAVDFTVPGYLDKVADKIAERDVEKAEEVQQEEEKWYNRIGEWFADKGSEVAQFLGATGDDESQYSDLHKIKAGLDQQNEKFERDTTPILEAEHGSMSPDDMLKKYASNALGVEIVGDLTDGEREIVEDVLAKVEAATDVGSTEEEREAARWGVLSLKQLVGQIAADPERRDSYKANESYTSVYDKQPEEPREGMAPMTAEPMAYTGEDGQPVDPYSMPEADAYEQMLQGGEWDTNALGWGYSMSNNPTAIEAELVEGVLGIFNGQKPTGLSKSWYNEFSGLMNNTNKAVRPTGLSQGERDVHAANPELYDSRHMYGSQVYDALMTNQKALDDGALHPVDYVKNLIVISAAAEAIGEAAGGIRATDEQAAEVLATNNGELQAMLDSANDICAQGQEAKAAAEAEVQQKIIGIVDAYAAGEQLDMKSETVMNSILSMDVSKAAAEDSTYQDISAQVKDSLSMDNLLRNGMMFTTGDFETDMMIDHAELQQRGALAYGQGVMMVVEDMLDEDMRLASACGMTLGEYYEAHPERARSSEQMLAEAQTRYDSTWNEFGKTISGLTAANQKLDGVEESTVDSLSLKDNIGIIADKFGIQLEADLRKTGHFLSYAWRDQGQKKNALMQQYGNDRTAFAADLNELEKGELTRLQGVYENDASKGDMQFDEWVKQHPEGAHLRELRTMREANVDIFDIGMTVDEIKSGWGIADVTGTMANIDALVEEHGSDADKFIVQSGVSLLNTGVMMATTALGGGGIAGSLAATAANAGANAHDRFQQTGNFDAALWSSVAEWGVNAIIEKIGFDRYMPEGIGGGNLATKMMHSKYILATQNLAQIVRSPESMSKVARGIFAAGIQGFVDAGSEFMEEFSQGIVSAMADNFAYSKPYLLTAKQLGEAAKEGIMAAVTAPILSLASGNKISFSDAAGNLIDSAQALLLPEHDGAILNDAIDFQSTRLAIQNSQDALNQIEQSSENAAKKQAGADLQAANAELAEAQTELATVQEQEAAAGAALEAANAEMNSGVPFTEELGKRMAAAADNVNKVREHLAKVQQRVQAASEHQTEAQQKYEDAKAAVQKMYDELMQTAKAEAEQLVTDLFFGGDSEAQRAAMDRYRAACQKLMDAKNNLRSAKANAEMYSRGTNLGDSAYDYYGEALLEVEALTEEVAAAKAEVDTAYAATGEGQMQTQQNADLTAAEEAAALAAEKAAASPGNQNLQAQAELAQAQLNTIRAKQTLDEKRADIGKRLQSPRSTDREAAVQEWNELQQAANDAAAEADRLQTEVDTTDTQKNLRSAIDNMKQYGPMDLIDENSANHEAAVEAYSELLAAEEAVRIENAQRAMNEAYANMDAGNPESVQAFEEARIRVTESAENRAATKKDSEGEIDMAEDGMAEGEGEEYDFGGNEEARKIYDGIMQEYKGTARQTPSTTESEAVAYLKMNQAFWKVTDELREGTVDDSSIDAYRAAANEYRAMTNPDRNHGGHTIDSLFNDLQTILQTNSPKARHKALQGYFKMVDVVHGDAVDADGEVLRNYEAAMAQLGGKGKKSAPGVHFRKSTSANALYDKERATGIYPGSRQTSDGWITNRHGRDGANTTKAGKNPIEIMRDLTASIKVGYSPNGPMNVKGSRVSQDVMAFYNDNTRGIRIRGQYAGDLDTGLHEFGHAVQQRLGALKATPDMVAALPAEVRKEYSAAELDGEAVAEFVAEYMYGRAGAVRAAGEEYVQAFEEMLRKDPVLNAAMARGRDQVTLWANADAASRLAASIKDADTAQQRDKPQYDGIKDWLSALRTKVVDSKFPLLKIGKDVFDMKKWEASAKERANVLFNRDFVDLEGNYMGPSVSQQLNDTGWTYSKQNEEDLNTYLLAQLAIDRTNQKKPLSGQTAGYTKADWEGIMKDIAKRNPTIPKAAKVWVNVWQDFVDGWLVPNGQMTAETRDQLREMYPNYVPTKRVVDVDWNKGGKISGDAFKLRGLKATPSDLEFINPVQQIAQMIDSGVRAVSRNQVLQTLDRVIQKDPEGLEWLIKQVPADMAVDKNDVDPIREALNAALKNADGVDPEAINRAFDLLGDMEEQWKTLTRSSRPNVVSGRRSDGKAFYYQVEQGNRDLFEAIVGSEPITNKFLLMAKKVTNGFSRLATQLSPTFSLSNFFADSPTSIATGTWAATPLDAVGKQIVGMIELIRNTPDARAFYAMGGGMQDRYNMNEGKGIQKFREDVLGQKTFNSRAKKLGLNVMTLGTVRATELLEVLNRYVEVRFGKHDLSTFEGRVKAMNAQQDVTVDFGTSGSSQALRSALCFIPFGNAAIQGLDKTVRMFEGLGSKDPEVRSRSGKAIAKTVTCASIYAAAQVYALGALKELFFGDDDDDEDERKREQYALISDEMKAGNLMIPIESNVFDQERLWIRIPMTRDAFGKAMFSVFMDGFSSLTDMDELHIDAWGVAAAAIKDSAPSDLVTDVITDSIHNITWYGRPIVSDYAMEHYSGANQTTSTTAKPFVGLANAINNAARVVGVKADVSPAVLQYAVQQGFGYIADVVIPFMSGDRYTGERSLRVSLKNVARELSSRFTLNPMASNDVQKEFEDAGTTLTRIMGDAEAGNPINYLGYSLTDAERDNAVEEAKDLMGLYGGLERANKGYWAEISDVQEAEGLTDAEKAQQINAIREDMLAGEIEFLMEYESYENEYINCDPIAAKLKNIFKPRPTLD